MTTDKTGRIVWHDLFTTDRPRSMSFYESVAGWHYVTEHATDFAWGGGEKDFVLALLGDEAGAGFAEAPAVMRDEWVAYVEVADVDVAAERAVELGGKVVKPPFEVPGVGRNCLLRDPLGALIGIALSRHSFPLPERQFGPEIYVARETDFPEAFYAGLFGWRELAGDAGGSCSAVRDANDREVAVCVRANTSFDADGVWVPNLKVAAKGASVDDAEVLGAQGIMDEVALSDKASCTILRDPNGALFALATPET